MTEGEKTTTELEWLLKELADAIHSRNVAVNKYKELLQRREPAALELTEKEFRQLLQLVHPDAHPESRQELALKVTKLLLSKREKHQARTA